MFIVEQRNIFIVNNNTIMNVKSNVNNENDHDKIHVKIKINKVDIFDKNQRKLKT